jgi:type I restriction enzyme S subunit
MNGDRAITARENYPIVPLDELCDLCSGITKGRKLDSPDTVDVPYMAVANVQDGRLSLDNVKTIEATPEEIERYLLRPGDLLLTEGGDPDKLGRGAIWKGEIGTCIHQNHIFRARKATERIQMEYLAHLVSSPYGKRYFLRQSKQTTGIASINMGQLKRFPVPLPPLEEQRRIAAILDSVNRLAQLRQRSRKVIDHLKQATFRSALINRKTQSSGGASISLGECLNFITSGGRGWSKYYADSGFRFIRSGDVQMNRVIRSNPQYVQPPDTAEAKRTRVVDEDVLLTITGSRIGRVAPASSEDSGAFISQHVAIIRVDNTKLLPSFVSFFLSMPGGGQVQIKKSQYGQTKPGLNFEQIQKFSIPRISLDEQLEIMSRIASINNLLDTQSGHATRIDEVLASVSAFAFNADIEI